MYLRVGGFQDAVNNGVFPILGPGPDATPGSLLVINPAAMPATSLEAGPYSLLTGQGPIPAADEATAFTGFLDPANAITIDKAAGAMIPAFQLMLNPLGAGMQLAPDSADPTAFDLTADAVTFSCGTTCGDGEPIDSSQLAALVVSGTAVDGDLPNPTNATLATKLNLDLENSTKMLSFTCSAVGGPVTLSQELLTKLKEFNPTRLRISVVRASAALSVPSTSVIAGHGVLGITDFPPAQPAP